MDSPQPHQGLRVREATVADVPVLVQIEQQCYAQPWTEQRFKQELENSVSSVLVGVNGGSLIAFICFWHLGEDVEIHNVACAPAYRRSGAAQGLMKYLECWCTEHRIENIFLEVRSSNAAAIRLYTRNGFTVNGCRAAYYSDGEDALLMQRTLMDG